MMVLFSLFFIKKKVGTVFYQNLFLDNPGALALFTSFKDEPDMFKSEKFLCHARKLVASVNGAVEFLNEPVRIFIITNKSTISHNNVADE